MPTIRQAVAANPPSARAAARGFDARAVVALALFGIKLPDDPPRIALDRIDADPLEFTADIRRQLAGKRGLTNPSAIASIDPDPEIRRIVADVEAFVSARRSECPECYPPPDRKGLDPIDAQQQLRTHLREAMQSPVYVARWIAEADKVLSVIERPDFVERCRLRGEPADEQRLGILTVVRSIVGMVISQTLPTKPTVDTLPESIQLHRQLLESSNAMIPANGASREDWFSLNAIADRIGYSPKQTDRKIKAARLRPEKRAGINHYGPWSKVCEALEVPSNTTPPKRGPLRKPRKDRKPRQ